MDERPEDLGQRDQVFRRREETTGGGHEFRAGRDRLGAGDDQIADAAGHIRRKHLLHVHGGEAWIRRVRDLEGHGSQGQAEPFHHRAHPGRAHVERLAAQRQDAAVRVRHRHQARVLRRDGLQRAGGQRDVAPCRSQGGPEQDSEPHDRAGRGLLQAARAAQPRLRDGRRAALAAPGLLHGGGEGCPAEEPRELEPHEAWSRVPDLCEQHPPS
mmetsp:Transcript_67605/g.176025  ORF Transcript_67605/g.176025 Transcript_67605/m.176025 type:complete len:213 (-) Transcript_67605:454-1092(-)